MDTPKATHGADTQLEACPQANARDAKTRVARRTSGYSNDGLEELKMPACPLYDAEHLVWRTRSM